MSRGVKLANLPSKQSAMEDYRCWAQIATEFLMEIREHLITQPKSVSNDQMIKRVDHFLEHDKLPPLSH